MRFLIAGLALALMMASAQAQMGQGSQMGAASQVGSNASKSSHMNDGKEAEGKVKANDKDYNAALRNLPNKQYDPWRGVR
jgi:hypothetical protein